MRPALRHRAVPDLTIHRARINLTAFALTQAKEAQAHVGFGWRAARLAPSTYLDVLREHELSRTSGLPYRVSSLYCQDTIFTSAESNQAMRFWHDMAHVCFGLTFSPDDEMELGIHHLQTLRSAGFEPRSCEFRLLHADTIGQTLCSVELGHFPRHQRRFATTALTHGLAAAIAEEAETDVDAALAQLGGDAA